MNQYVSSSSIPNLIKPILESLFQEIAHLHVKWGEYRTLYGTSADNVTLLNESAPKFFGLVQHVLLDDILLTIRRLIDLAETSTKAGKSKNISLQQLKTQIDQSQEIALIRQIDAALKKVEQNTKFVKVHGNKRIAHNDYDVKRQSSSTLLPDFSRQQIEDALAAIRDVMVTVEKHYNVNPTTDFQLFQNIASNRSSKKSGWASDLIALLKHVSEANELTP